MKNLSAVVAVEEEESSELWVLSLSPMLYLAGCEQSKAVWDF